MEDNSQSNQLTFNCGTDSEDETNCEELNQSSDSQRQQSFGKRLKDLELMAEKTKTKLNSLSVFSVKKTIKFVDNFAVISDKSEDNIETYIKPIEESLTSSYGSEEEPIFDKTSIDDTVKARSVANEDQRAAQMEAFEWKLKRFKPKPKIKSSISCIEETSTPIDTLLDTDSMFMSTEASVSDIYSKMNKLRANLYKEVVEELTQSPKRMDVLESGPKIVSLKTPVKNNFSTSTQTIFGTNLRTEFRADVCKVVVKRITQTPNPMDVLESGSKLGKSVSFMTPLENSSLTSTQTSILDTISAPILDIVSNITQTTLKPIIKKTNSVPNPKKNLQKKAKTQPIQEVFINELILRDKCSVTTIRTKTRPQPIPKCNNECKCKPDLTQIIQTNQRKPKKSKKNSNKPKYYKIELDFIESIHSNDGKPLVPFIALSAEKLALLRRFLDPKLPYISTDIIKDTEELKRYFVEKNKLIEELDSKITETQSKISEIKGQLADTPNRHRKKRFDAKTKKWCPYCLNEVETNAFKIDLKHKGIEYFCSEECLQNYKESIVRVENDSLIAKMDDLYVEDMEEDFNSKNEVLNEE